MLRIGSWRVNPASGQISRDGETARLEMRTMRLLVCLAEHAGEVVSIDELLNQAWSGVADSPDSVYQAVTSLRRLLGDDPRQPTYIETVPRLGYRLLAAVSPWPEPASQEPARQESSSANPSSPDPFSHNPVVAEEAASSQPAAPADASPAPDGEHPSTAANDGPAPPAAPAAQRFPWVDVAAALGLALTIAFVAFLFHSKAANNNRPAAPAPAPQPVESIAVLPLLDLTEEMNEEPFADGMTEELIDRLGKVPGLRVAAPTSSFDFKGKQVPVAEIAKSLGVVYVLEGSVRKSGDRLRVAVQLIRAGNGYVVWSETYDRPFHEILMVQDDIAGAVAKALRESPEFQAH
ncbi:MAG: winged helix-turn-helix domain-containing protein [Terracidiphilus sp.]